MAWAVASISGHHAGFEAARRRLPQADDMDFVALACTSPIRAITLEVPMSSALIVFAFYHDVPFIFCLLLIVIGG